MSASSLIDKYKIGLSSVWNWTDYSEILFSSASAVSNFFAFVSKEFSTFGEFCEEN